MYLRMNNMQMDLHIYIYIDQTITYRGGGPIHCLPGNSQLPNGLGIKTSCLRCPKALFDGPPSDEPP